MKFTKQAAAMNFLKHAARFVAIGITGGCIAFVAVVALLAAEGLI